MDLLNKIIDGATEDSEPLPNLLRKCLVLAHQLKNEKLATWAQKELNGYDKDDPLPPYRVIGIVARGFFIGAFQSQLNDQPLPPGVLDPEHRDWARIANLTQPVASYEGLGRDGNPQIPWPPSLTARYQTKFFEHLVLNRAWQEIPASAFIGLTDTVRNRILTFALELKSQLGGVSDKPERLEPEQVDKSVVYHIYGGNIVIASTAQTINQAGKDIVINGDAESLIKALLGFGVEQADADEIIKTLSEDSRGPSLGQKAISLIKTVGAKVSRGCNNRICGNFGYYKAGPSVHRNGLTSAMAKKAPKKAHTWAVSLIKKHGQFLGYVEAPDRETGGRCCRAPPADPASRNINRTQVVNPSPNRRYPRTERSPATGSHAKSGHARRWPGPHCFLIVTGLRLATMFQEANCSSLWGTAAIPAATPLSTCKVTVRCFDAVAICRHK